MDADRAIVPPRRTATLRLTFAGYELRAGRRGTGCLYRGIVPAAPLAEALRLATDVCRELGVTLNSTVRFEADGVPCFVPVTDFDSDRPLRAQVRELLGMERGRRA